MPRPQRVKAQRTVAHFEGYLLPLALKEGEPSFHDLAIHHVGTGFYKKTRLPHRPPSNAIEQEKNRKHLRELNAAVRRYECNIEEAILEQRPASELMDICKTSSEYFFADYAGTVADLLILAENGYAQVGGECDVDWVLRGNCLIFRYHWETHG